MQDISTRTFTKNDSGFVCGHCGKTVLPLGGEGSLSGFALVTEIYLQRQCLSVFLSRRKKNSEKERPLRGFRREVSFIISPQEGAAK